MYLKTNTLVLSTTNMYVHVIKRINGTFQAAGNTINVRVPLLKVCHVLVFMWYDTEKSH